MKRLSLCVAVLALFSSLLAGCAGTAAKQDAKPAEVHPSARKPRPGKKDVENQIPITITKYTPTPTPTPKGMKPGAKKPRPKTASAVSFQATVDTALWPSGLDCM